MNVSVRQLISSLDSAVDESDDRRIVETVKCRLEETIRAGRLELPPKLVAPLPDGYARRLLHRDPAGRYTAVVMTWGPGQGTQLHDHAGLWCVECVVRGQLLVTQYDLVRTEHERFSFERRATVRTVVGDAGCLIPPYEYHVLENDCADEASVTLHVYGGEMQRCNLYEPDAAGWWARRSRSLSYHG